MEYHTIQQSVMSIGAALDPLPTPCITLKDCSVANSEALLVCPGFTPQYKELGQLYNKYSDDGFVILGKH